MCVHGGISVNFVLLTDTDNFEKVTLDTDMKTQYKANLVTYKLRHTKDKKAISVELLVHKLYILLYNSNIKNSIA